MLRRLSSTRSMLPVPPNVAPTISLELDVDDGEVENYEVNTNTTLTVSFHTNELVH